MHFRISKIYLFLLMLYHLMVNAKNNLFFTHSCLFWALNCGKPQPDFKDVELQTAPLHLFSLKLWCLNYEYKDAGSVNHSDCWSLYSFVHLIFDDYHFVRSDTPSSRWYLGSVIIVYCNMAELGFWLR